MALKFKDYYETLGVSKAATPDEIKQAFRKLARIYHPDVAKNKATGEVKFKEINEAYEVLGDPEKRKRYDELGIDWQDEPGMSEHPGRGRTPRRERPLTWTLSSGARIQRLLRLLFRKRPETQEINPASTVSARGGWPRLFPEPGRDVEADVMVTLEEALKGSRRNASPKSRVRSDTYQVRRPPDVREGQAEDTAPPARVAPVSGEERPGTSASRPSHPKPGFPQEPGSDLYFDLELAPGEAILGVNVKVPALTGQLP